MDPNKLNRNTEWHLWCRLCANEDPQGNVNIFERNQELKKEGHSSNSKEVIDMSLVAAIDKYFSVKIVKNDELPKILCSECFSRMTVLVNFGKRVKKTQQLFDVLLNTPSEESSHLDLHAMRLNYQLSDKDHEQTLPVMHFVDIKTEENLNEMQTIDPLEQLEKEIKIENEICVQQYPWEKEQKLIKLEDAIETQDTNTTSKDVNKVKKTHTQITNDVSAELKIEQVPYDEKDISDKQENGNNTIFSCSKCPQKFQRLSAYEKHVKRNHLACLQCPKVFMTQEELDQHSQKHLPIEMKKTFSCPHCEKKFTTDLKLNLHINHIHLNECLYICEECGEPAPTIQTLNYHMLKHTDETPFECEFCKKRFKHQRFLKKHMRHHDNIDHICKECGLQLKNAITLKHHMLVHSNELNFKCVHCERGFKRAKALKCHLIIHTGLKPYSCDFCDRTFASGSNCRTHIRKSHPEELAAKEATGAKTVIKNIPKLRTLIATTKNSSNIVPVASKPSGNFGHKRKIK